MIFALIVLGLILLVLLLSYILYRRFKPRDPDIESDDAALGYFRESYDNCRAAFRGRAVDIVRANANAEYGHWQIPGQLDHDLTMDWCHIPARGTKNKLLILNSGLHGIEGYTGSAVQLMFIDRFLDKLPGDTGVLLIHGINAYGFKYHRKVTENNVDLNRNCVTGSQMFNIENSGYGELRNMLMPTKPVNINSIGNQFFYLTAIYKILRKSMRTLRQAALQGQYDYPKGFYYGGNAFEPQIDSLRTLLTGFIEQYQMTLNVDLHTAYGERGKLHLFIDKPEDPEVLNGIETIFSGVNIDWGNSGNFYTILGDYIGWVSTLVPHRLCLPMLFEFGTLDSQKTFGSLKSLQIMILENQGFHYG